MEVLTINIQRKKLCKSILTSVFICGNLSSLRICIWLSFDKIINKVRALFLTVIGRVLTATLILLQFISLESSFFSSSIVLLTFIFTTSSTFPFESFLLLIFFSSIFCEFKLLSLSSSFTLFIYLHWYIYLKISSEVVYYSIMSIYLILQLVWY